MLFRPGCPEIIPAPFTFLSLTLDYAQNVFDGKSTNGATWGAADFGVESQTPATPCQGTD